MNPLPNQMACGLSLLLQPIGDCSLCIIHGFNSHSVWIGEPITLLVYYNYCGTQWETGICRFLSISDFQLYFSHESLLSSWPAYLTLELKYQNYYNKIITQYATYNTLYYKFIDWLLWIIFISSHFNELIM